MATLQSNLNDDLPTNSSLLVRIRTSGDTESWREFFNMYKASIAGLAMKGGLNGAEADEVLQETMLAVHKGIANFDYNREEGSFKGWLSTITRRAMYRQLRKRGPAGERSISSRSKTPLPEPVAVHASDSQLEAADVAGDELALLPDTSPGLEQHFEKEWRQALLALAFKRVRQHVKPKQFQMFDLYVTQQMPMSKVTRLLNVNAAQVYMAKLRVSASLRQAITSLERELI